MPTNDTANSPTSNEREEQQQVPERLWVELRTQHAFTLQPEPYVETVEYMSVDLFNTHYEDLMRASLLREANAATAMRDKCIDAVRAMRNARAKALNALANDDNHEDEADHERAILFVLANVIDNIQSLTLD